jgi:hypothetical protein
MYNLQGYSSKWLSSSSHVLSPKVSTTSQNSATSKKKSIWHMSLWGDISFSYYNIPPLHPKVSQPAHNPWCI